MNGEVAEKINELKNDELHGAGWLSREAINTLNLAVGESQAHTIADFIDETKAVAAELTKARPSMVSVANYIRLFLHQITLGAQNEKALDSLKSFALAKGNEFIKLSEEATSKAAGNAASIISNLDMVITCSYSSTVCRVFELAKQKGAKFHIMVAESRFKDKAYGKITAERLKQHLITGEVIPDEDIRLHVSKADKVLVGADSILADVSLINGMPTHTLASAAKDENIPFYTVCETAKFDIQGYISEPEPGFDKTPSALITGIITERGIMEPSQVITYIEKMAGFSF